MSATPQSTFAAEEGELMRHVTSRSSNLLIADRLAGVAIPVGKSAKASDTLLSELATIPNGTHNHNAIESASTGLREAFAVAENRFRLAIAADPSLRGVGASAAVALMLNTEIVVAHIGDCRIHLFREGKLVRRTTEHVLPTNPGIVVRVFGAGTPAAPEIDVWQIAARDICLLTGTVHDVLTSDEIGSVVTSSSTPQAIVCNLVNQAVLRGATDDVVALALAIPSSGQPWVEAADERGTVERKMPDEHP
jgi:protein phosphatase